MDIDFTQIIDYIVTLNNYDCFCVSCMEVDITGDFIRFLNCSNTGFYFTVSIILKNQVKSIFKRKGEMIYHV